MISLFPPVFVSNETGGPNGTRKLFWIVMYPGGDAAVLAQELREFGLVFRLFVLPGLAMLAAALWGASQGHVGAGVAVAAFVLMCALWLSVAASPVARWLEYRGHEAEVQAAVALYGADETAYRAKEADTMHRKYSGMFAHLSVTQIVIAMETQTPGAKRFVRARMGLLERYKHEVR